VAVDPAVAILVERREGPTRGLDFPRVEFMVAIGVERGPQPIGRPVGWRPVSGRALGFGKGGDGEQDRGRRDGDQGGRWWVAAVHGGFPCGVSMPVREV
jgi:hypothetical protein